MLSSQAGIAAPTQTVMQGFEAKEDSAVHPFQVPAYCITHAQLNREPYPSAEGWELCIITTTPPTLQQWTDKMSYLNQMYEKKAMARAWAFAWLASTSNCHWNERWFHLKLLLIIWIYFRKKSEPREVFATSVLFTLKKILFPIIGCEFWLKRWRSLRSAGHVVLETNCGFPTAASLVNKY